VLILALVGCGGSTPPAPLPPPPRPAPAAPDADEHVDRNLDRIDADAREIESLLSRKRRERDSVWVTCLSDKLSQIHVARRSAKERRMTMQQALDLHDDGSAARDRHVVMTLRQRADQLTAEGRMCVT
jgi:hypothetical protein